MKEHIATSNKILNDDSRTQTTCSECEWEISIPGGPTIMITIRSPY